MEKEWTESVLSPAEEIELWGKSKLCIDIKYNTKLPDDLLKNASSPWVPVETGLQANYNSVLILNITPHYLENVLSTKEDTGAL